MTYFQQLGILAAMEAAQQKRAEAGSFNRVEVAPGIAVDGPDANDVFGIHHLHAILWLSRAEAVALGTELLKRGAR